MSECTLEHQLTVGIFRRNFKERIVFVHSIFMGEKVCGGGGGVVQVICGKKIFGKKTRFKVLGKKAFYFFNSTKALVFFFLLFSFFFCFILYSFSSRCSSSFPPCYALSCFDLAGKSRILKLAGKIPFSKIFLRTPLFDLAIWSGIEESLLIKIRYNTLDRNSTNQVDLLRSVRPY